MNHNVYLPDDLSERVREAELNLSRLVRDTVTAELERRAAVTQTIDGAKVHELTLEDENGATYTARITGTLIAGTDSADVFLTDQENVVYYDTHNLRYHVLDDPEEQLRGWLPEGEYVDAMNALGITPTIDLDI